MHFRAITRIVGLLVILFSGTMIIPGLVALLYRDGAGRAFTQTFFVALVIGSLLWWGWTRCLMPSCFTGKCCNGSAGWGSSCWPWLFCLSWG